MDVYGIYNYSYWGESKPTNITVGPHIAALLVFTRGPVPVLDPYITKKYVFFALFLAPDIS